MYVIQLVIEIFTLSEGVHTCVKLSLLVCICWINDKKSDTATVKKSLIPEVHSKNVTAILFQLYKMAAVGVWRLFGRSVASQARKLRETGCHRLNGN